MKYAPGWKLLLQQRPVLVSDLRPRVGVENRHSGIH